MWRAAFLILSGTLFLGKAPPFPAQRKGWATSSSLHGYGEGFANGVGEPFDPLARGRFRDANEAAFRELGIIRAERKRADDFVAQQLRVDHAHRARELHRKFIEDGAIKYAAHAGEFFEFGERKLRLGDLLFGHFAQALAAEPTGM